MKTNLKLKLIKLFIINSMIMNKKIVLVLTGFILLFYFTGCGSNSLKIELPELPEEFFLYEFINPDQSEDGYIAFDYNKRTYIPYGSLKNKLTKNDINSCLGYTVSDGNKNTNDLILTLTDCENNDYLMIYYSDDNSMQQPVFYRAIDTKNQNINTMDYISNLSYGYWKN